MAFTQTVWDTLPWKSYADYRLQNLNKSYVNTGVLYDRVFPIAQLDERTGLLPNEDTTSSDHSYLGSCLTNHFKTHFLNLLEKEK